MNTYIYQVMTELPHPDGSVNYEIVARSVFSGDAELLAKINKADADAIYEYKNTQDIN